VKSEVESDEAMAARLQAELNQAARSTRGGGVTKRKAPAKKDKLAKKKKSSAKLKAEDDSELDSGADEKPEKEKKGGFHVSQLPVSTLLAPPTNTTLPSYRNQWRSPNLSPHYWANPYYLAHNASKKSGNTSKRGTCRIPPTNAKSAAMIECVRFSRAIACTCLR
jgi:hypothetical protein